MSWEISSYEYKWQGLAEAMGISTPVFGMPYNRLSSMHPHELATWYKIACNLDAGKGCSCKLQIWDRSPSQDDDSEMLGQHDPETNTISVVNHYNPYENIATILHEVAHAVCNPRHGRSHGYSWRRKFSALIEELSGFSPNQLALAYRASNPIFNKRMALDTAALYIITTNYYYIDLRISRKFPELHRELMYGSEEKSHATYVMAPL